MAKKPPPGFNTPFRELKPLPPKPAAPAAPAKPPPPARKTPPREDDQRAFEEAMRGVTPLGERERRQREIEAPPPERRPAVQREARRVHEDALAEAELADFVGGDKALTTEELGESVSAWAPGIDRRVLKRLRAGQFPVEAELDLHQRSREQATSDLTRFLTSARREGKRCVLVIHGRGLNSGPEGAVLRGAVRQTLAEGPLRRQVLAFTSAPPTHGGPGALLILLRRDPR